MTRHTKLSPPFSRWPYRSVIAAIVLLLWAPNVARSDNFVIYFPNSRVILPVRTYDSVRYLPILKLLNAFGHVGGLQEKKKSLRVWFGGTEIRFREKNRIIQLHGAKIKLSDRVRVEGGEWLVPTDFLTQILPSLTNQEIEYRVGDERAFVGKIKPNILSVHQQPVTGGTRLTFQFSAPITLRTAARNGKWLLYLGDRPVESATPSFLQAPNPYLARIHFDDQDGHPKLILTPAMPGLDFYPKLSADGKSLVAEILKPPMATRAPAPASQPNLLPQPGVGQAPAGQPPTPGQPSTPLLPAVVLDAGHGGSDSGARGGAGMLEKDLNAQVVARVGRALAATGRYRIVLTRPGDRTVDFEQRAAEANVAHPVAFISFHAGNLGATVPQVMVYTYRPSSPEAPSPTGGPQMLLIPWSKVQLVFASESRRLALKLQQGLARTTGAAAVPPREVPIRTLQSIAAPAAAVEIGSFFPGADPASLLQPSFQDQIASAVVQAIGDFLGGQ